MDTMHLSISPKARTTTTTIIQAEPPSTLKQMTLCQSYKNKELWGKKTHDLMAIFESCMNCDLVHRQLQYLFHTWLHRVFISSLDGSVHVVWTVSSHWISPRGVRHSAVHISLGKSVKHVAFAAGEWSLTRPLNCSLFVVSIKSYVIHMVRLKKKLWINVKNLASFKFQLVK